MTTVHSPRSSLRKYNQRTPTAKTIVRVCSCVTRFDTSIVFLSSCGVGFGGIFTWRYESFYHGLLGLIGAYPPPKKILYIPWYVDGTKANREVDAAKTCICYTFVRCCARTVFDLGLQSHYFLPSRGLRVRLRLLRLLSPQVDAYTLPSERGESRLSDFMLCLSSRYSRRRTFEYSTCVEWTRSSIFSTVVHCPRLDCCITYCPFRQNFTSCRVFYRTWYHRSHVRSKLHEIVRLRIRMMLLSG